MTKQVLRRRISTLWPSDGLRGNVMTLLSGSTAAMAVAYLAQPVLTRLYSPSDFGTLDAFVALVATVGPLLSLRYDDAILLPEDEDEAAGVLWLCIGLSLLFALLSILFIPLRDELAGLLGHAGLAPWIALLPPVLVFIRIVNLSEQWLKRKKRFRSLGLAEITLTLGTVSTRLATAVLVVGIGAAGLIGGFIAGYLLTAVLLVACVDTRPLRSGLRMSRLRYSFQRYRRFPIYSTPAFLLKSVAAVLPTLLLLAYFDERVVGHYGRVFMVLSAPLVIIGKAIGKVYHAESARLLHDGGVTDLTSRIHKRVVLLGLFPTLVLMLAGPDILTIILGAEWTATGRYLRFLGPWLFLTAVTVPFGSLFDLLERQRGDLALSGVMFTLQTGALVLAARTGDVMLTLLALGVSGALVRALHLSVMMHLAEVPLRSLLSHYALALFTSLPLLAVLGVVMRYASALGVCAAAALAGLGYLAFAWKKGWL